MALVPEIFEKDKRYRVKKSFMKGVTTFFAGEILTFEFESYGRYDDCFSYIFHSQTHGGEKSWMIFENESAESWRDYFEPFTPDYNS